MIKIKRIMDMSLLFLCNIFFSGLVNSNSMDVVTSLIGNQIDNICDHTLIAIYETTETRHLPHTQESDNSIPLISPHTPYREHFLLNMFHNTSNASPISVLRIQNCGVVPETFALENLDGRTEACAVVIFLSSSQSIDCVMEVLASSAIWTPRAPHLVVQSGNASEGDMRVALQALWHARAARVALLNTRATGSGALRVAWGAPFTRGRRCLEAGDAAVHTADVSGATNRYMAKLREKMYPPRGVRQFRQCVVKLSAYPWTAYTMKNESLGPHNGFDEGIEVRMIREIAKKMDFVFEFLPDPSDYGATGMQVINGTGDVAIGALILMEEFYPEMDPTVSYITEPIVWWVPRGAPVPRSLAIAFVFSARLWLAVLASALVALVAFAALHDRDAPAPAPAFTRVSKTDEKDEDRKENSTVKNDNKNGLKAWAMGAWAWAMDAWAGARRALAERLKDAPALWVFAVLLCASVAKQPSDGLYRAAFLVWVLGAFIINTAYQSALVGFLANPGTFHEIQDVDELLASDLVAGLSPEITEVLSDVDDPKYNHFLSRARLCQEMSTCLDRVAFNRDMAVPMDKSFITVLYDSSRRSQLKLLAVVSNYNIIMYMAHNFPLLEAFNEHVRGLVEGGLVDLWWDQITDGPWNQKPGDPGPQVMTLSHLQGAFCLLILGLVASFTCFLCEKTSRRKKKLGHQQQTKTMKKNAHDESIQP